MTRMGQFLLVFVCAGATMFSQTPTGSGTAVILDRKFVTNDKLHCDSLVLSMTGVSGPVQGFRYYAWLVEDNDAAYRSLGPLTVTAGSVLLTYAEPTFNLVARYKQVVISEEVDPYGGAAPSAGAIRFRGALYEGAGTPGPANALTWLRNVLGTFNTPNSLGLMSWMVYQLTKNDNMVQHAGFAANSGSIADVKMHTDHSFDFAHGALSGLTTASTIANNGDPLGYSLYRYGDLDTLYTGFGGAGYHIARAMQQADATPSMLAEGNNALTALRNVLGTDNVSGWAKDFKDACVGIFVTNYGANLAQAKADAAGMRGLAQRVQDGSVAAGNTDPATGGIFVARWRALAMATYTIQPVVQPPGKVLPAFPDSGASVATTSPTIGWFAVAEADSYRIQLSPDEVFAGGIVDTTIATDTSIVAGPLAHGALVYWRVRAVNAAGAGPWSAVRSFITPLSLPAAVTLVSPSNEEVIQADSVEAVWNHSTPSVSGYWFEVSDDSTFGTSAVDSTLSSADTSKVVHSLLDGSRYFWRVRARNSSGWGAFSEVRVFSRATPVGVSFDETPGRFFLAQNYPNPFNPETNVLFGLSTASTVRIGVFDLLGRNVAMLLDGELPAGSHTVKWNAESLAGGVYILRIDAVGKEGVAMMATRKGVVLK